MPQKRVLERIIGPRCLLDAMGEGSRKLALPVLGGHQVPGAFCDRGSQSLLHTEQEEWSEAALESAGRHSLT